MSSGRSRMRWPPLASEMQRKSSMKNTSLILLLLAGCASVIPPGPPTYDDYAGLVAYCQDVADEMPRALPSVRTCLTGPEPDGCMVALESLYALPVVACDVRAAGLRAFAVPEAVRDAATTAMATASQRWIRAHGVSYQDN